MITFYNDIRVNKMFLGSSDSSEINLQVVGPDSDVIYAALEFDRFLQYYENAADLNVRDDRRSERTSDRFNERSTDRREPGAKSRRNLAIEFTSIRH